MSAGDSRLASFPTELRELIGAELAAGNRIVEIASCFPAPPAGMYVKLEGAVSTRERRSTAAVKYFDRNSPQYSGEWSDERRFFFVLEPPRPPEPEINMDERRQALQPLGVDPVRLTSAPAPSATKSVAPPASVTAPAARELSRVDRFRASMTMDYEKWHDGIGYDVALIRGASLDEKAQIESLLLQRSARDWRDVEGLGLLDTPRARAALREAFVTGDAELRAAVVRAAPALVSDDEMTTHLIDGVQTSAVYRGLSQVLAAIETFHPSPVMQALLRGALEREGEVAYHLAAMLLFLHGQARSRYDWSVRPFLLRFNTSDRAAREQVFHELCVRIGANPSEYS